MKMIKVWIDKELYDIVKEDADEKVMSVSEYVWYILSKKSYVEAVIIKQTLNQIAEKYNSSDSASDL